MARLSDDILAALPILIWLYLLAARGGFWRVPRRLPPQPREEGPARKIVAVVPARNEAAVIGEAVESLLRQQLHGSIHVIVVDDGSSDDTAGAAAAAAARLGAASSLSVIRGAPLPAGWTGKLWAMAQGVAGADARDPDYLLFTDADIHHDPQNVAGLVANAEASGRDLVSYMVRLSTATLAEKCLIPAFVFFFFMLYPPAWIASSRSRAAAAAGGCMLIRPAALARIGGLKSIRSRIIDDCALASAVKATGGSIWLGLARTARSIRPYGSFTEIGRMISRTAFNQLHHSYALLCLTLAGLFVTYGLPPLLLLTGRPVWIALGALAWALMSLAYRPMVRFHGLSSLWSPCLPMVAAFYAAATLHSAIEYRRGRGGRWKDRVQDLRA
jgi:hopene-associated glycosyltransferase HpnB